MSDAVTQALARLTPRVKADGLTGVIKFVLKGEGAIMLDQAGVRAGDDPADVTLTASAEVFHAMLSGDLSPMTAFMTGKLKVDGEMGLAMKLGTILG